MVDVPLTGHLVLALYRGQPDVAAAAEVVLGSATGAAIQILRQDGARAGLVAASLRHVPLVAC